MLKYNRIIPVLGLICLMFCLGVHNASAQAHFFRSVTLSDGLPHGQISDFAQSSNGYMWIGTAAAGLVGYDGINFRTYGMQHGLRDDMIIQVHVDRDEKIWVSTYSGGVAALVGDSIIYQFPEHILDEAYITTILESPSGELWFGTYYHGAFSYNAGEWSVIDTTNGLPNNTVWDIHWADDGRIWFATHDGIAVLENGEFHQYNTSDGISGSRVYRFASNSEGKIWMATSRGVTIAKDNTFTAHTSLNGRQLGYVFDILIDEKDRVWVGTENDGVYIIENGLANHFTRSDGLQSNHIHVLYNDKHDNIWIGTDENGISIYTDDSFRRYNRQHGLHSEEIYSLILASDRTIWAGTEAGLHQFTSGSFTIPQHLPEELSGKSIWALASLWDGSILALNNDNGVYHITSSTTTQILQGVLSDVYWIIDLFVDSSGKLWLATDSGLFLMDSPFASEAHRMSGLPGMVVYQIYESTSGTIWAATNLGVAYLNGDEFRSFTVADGLGHYNVNVIAEDNNGEIWFGTSAGFTHFQANADTSEVNFVNFGRLPGMRLQESLFLVFDDYGNLWQGTNGGLHRFKMESYNQTGSLVAKHYRLSRYGIGVETMQNAAFICDSGMLWFATMEGVLKADTKHISSKEYAVPSTYISQVIINGVSRPGSRGDAKSINESRGAPKLSSGLNTITFEFAGIEFISPQNLSFRYRLKGADADWNLVTDRTSTTYTMQRAGTYTFEVMARIGNGAWSEEPAVFTFYIKAPYWQQAWFWLVAVLVFGTSVQLLFRQRMRKAETLRLSQMVEEKTRDLQKALDERGILIKEVHHRVKNNLAMISGLLEMQVEYVNDERIERAFNDAQMRIMSIAMIHEKLYQNEDLSKIEVRAYVPQLINAIMNTVSGQYDNVKVHTDLDEIYLSIEQGIPCGLILNELISNAFKHAYKPGESGMVMVSVTTKDDKICLMVEDDGSGLPENFSLDQISSLGLHLVNELTDLMKGQLTSEQLEKGSRFTIEFQTGSGGMSS